MFHVLQSCICRLSRNKQSIDLDPAVVGHDDRVDLVSSLDLEGAGAAPPELGVLPQVQVLK